MQTGGRLSLTPTGSYLEDFIKDFSSTVGYEEPVTSRGESDDDSLGSGPDIELGEPPAGWTQELGLNDPLDYQEELIQATAGLMQAQGMLPHEPVTEGETVPLVNEAEVPPGQPVRMVPADVPQEEPVKVVPVTVSQDRAKTPEIGLKPLKSSNIIDLTADIYLTMVNTLFGTAGINVATTS